MNFTPNEKVMMRAPRKDRPIRDNLLRQLALAEKYLKDLQQLDSEGCGCGLQITHTEKEVEKLRRLTR